VYFQENSKEEPMDDIVWAKLEKEFVAVSSILYLCDQVD